MPSLTNCHLDLRRLDPPLSTTSRHFIVLTAPRQPRNRRLAAISTRHIEPARPRRPGAARLELISTRASVHAVRRALPASIRRFQTSRSGTSARARAELSARYAGRASAELPGQIELASALGGRTTKRLARSPRNRAGIDPVHQTSQPRVRCGNAVLSQSERESEPPDAVSDTNGAVRRRKVTV